MKEEPRLPLKGAQELLRIYINDGDRWQGRPLSQAIVAKVREAGLAGCTVLPSAGGFGSSGALHDARFEEAFLNLPLVVEIIDRPDRIEALIPVLDSMIPQGMITREKLQIRIHRATPGAEP